MRYRVLMLAAFLSALAASAGPAAAQPYRAREGVQSGQVQSLDQILNGIRRQRPGSLADVQGPSPSPEGEPRYRLKWVTPDGRVLWLDTDARTGRVLGVEGEDRGAPPGSMSRGPYGPPPGYPPAPGYPQAPNYREAPGYGRVPPGYPLQSGAVPQPQAYGPPQGYGPPPVAGPPVAGPPVVGPPGMEPPGMGPRGFGPRGFGPRGFIMRNGPRGEPGRGRDFRR